MNNQGLKKRVDREKTTDYAFIEVLQQRKNNRSPSLSGYILETVLAQYLQYAFCGSIVRYKLLRIPLPISEPNKKLTGDIEEAVLK